MSLKADCSVFFTPLLMALLVSTLGIAGLALGAAPVGSEFQVNTYTTNTQRGASVSSASNGDFVVVWSSYGSADGDTIGTSSHGQRFDSTGAIQGPQFQVNTYTTGYQSYPSVSLNADGDFVVVWQSYGSAGSDTHGYSIQGQRFSRFVPPPVPSIQPTGLLALVVLLAGGGLMRRCLRLPR